MRTGALALVLALAAASPAHAWTGKVRVQMVDEAVRLMPASLRLALEHHRDPLLRGALEPMLKEDGPAHRPSWGGGTLEREIPARAADLRAAVEAGRRFEEIARAFGALAHAVQDAGFPPGAAESDPGTRYAHFAAFVESRRPKFPLVFEGHDDPDLERGDVAGWTARVLARSREADRTLARAYAAAGTPPHPSAFDDRSIPFAVASLASSRTVTAIARAWLAAWRETGGDVGRTPYLEGTPR